MAVPTAVHAARGGAAALAALTLLANATRNRGAVAQMLVLRGRRALAALKVAPPSRNVAAVAVFVAVFRYVQRLESEAQERRRCAAEPGDSRSVVRAAVAASTLGVLCASPTSRAALVSLASTSAASLLLRRFLMSHPGLAHLAPIELLVFLASGGWIMYSAFFHRESYDPAHLQFIMKSTLVSPSTAAVIQSQYEQGLNPSTCTLRHPGVECSEYLFPGFMKRVVVAGYRMYLPVHLVAWLISLRHAKVRATPAPEMLVKLAVRLTRSALYYIGFVGAGWAASCYTSTLGARSLAWRKVQFALCGSLPALSIFFEQPSRRRPIGVVLVSYALVSASAVAARSSPLLQEGPVRSLLQVALFSGAAACVVPEMLRSHALLQRVLLGKKEKDARVESRKTEVSCQARRRVSTP